MDSRFPAIANVDKILSHRSTDPAPLPENLLQFDSQFFDRRIPIDGMPYPYPPKPFRPFGSEEGGPPHSHTGGGMSVSETESPLSHVSEPVIMLADSAIPNSVTMASTEVAPMISGDNESVFVLSEAVSEAVSESASGAFEIGDFEIGDLLIEGLQAFLT